MKQRIRNFNIMRKIIPLTILICCFHIVGQSQIYNMPAEHLQHEGTWIQWPHNFLYPPFFIDDVEPTVLDMVAALESGENVHIICYNVTEESRIKTEIAAAGIPTDNLFFYIYETNDVWVRDNGPMFVFDDANNLTILDWGFNGWGGDTPYNYCDLIPEKISNDFSLPYVDVNSMVLEGGAIEQDGNGTLIATRSSVTHTSRNPSLTESDIENYFDQYIGATNVIWLDGLYGAEITDMHIDGFVHFANDTLIVTMDSLDLIYWQLPPSDISILYNATDVLANTYSFVFLPLTQNDVVTTYGDNLGYKGSYVNYYIGNDVILVPTYGDPNDAVAISILETVHPARTAVGIDVRDLYAYGGMVHCITQQRPFDPAGVTIRENTKSVPSLDQNIPNPFDAKTTIGFTLQSSADIKIIIVDQLGNKIKEVNRKDLVVGKHSIEIEIVSLPIGSYYYTLYVDGVESGTRKMLISR